MQKSRQGFERQPQPTPRAKAPDSCSTCRFHLPDPDRGERYITCRRLPSYVVHLAVDWCGEFKPVVP
jgi:hypothetical protein